MEFETEEQQIEAFKKWWAENGNAILAGILAAVVGIGGYKFWTIKQVEKKENASIAYERFLDATSGDEAGADAFTQGEAVVEEHGDTEYAVLASLMMAKLAVEQRDYDKAASSLRWAVENGKHQNTVLVARLRLAKVLEQQEKHDEALQLLSGEVPAAFKAQYLELEGDIHYRKGELDSARAAYQQALEMLSDRPGNQGVLRMKLDNLAAGS